MAPVIALLLIAAFSFLVIRVGATALEHTGLSRDAARFQALSAFFGAGFTTGESELVVNHPVRRKVIRDLIIVGNIGVISLLTTGVATATVNSDEHSALTRITILVGGLTLIYLLSRSAILMRFIDFTIERALRGTGIVAAMDYEKVLRTHAGYGIAEIAIEEDSLLVGRTLAQSRPRDSGITILGIARASGDYDAAPESYTVINAGDTILAYGSDSALKYLSEHQAPPPADAPVPSDP